MRNIEITPLRSRDPEEEFLSTRANPTEQGKATRSKKSQPLTAENLRKHTEHEGKLNILELTDSEVDKGPECKGSKRSASGVGIGDGFTTSTVGNQEATSQVTQKSSFTAAHYRNTVLKGANIHFQFQLPPEVIYTQIADIVQLKPSSKRKKELSLIGQKFHDDFAEVLDTAAREKLVWSLYSIFSPCMLTQLIDWQSSLKPRIRLSKPRVDHLDREDEAGESLERPSKRQQRDEAYLSPDPSGAAVTAKWMEPPSISHSEVKTPRPDISIGLRDTAITKALQSRGLKGANLRELLQVLAMPRPPNDTPLLCSEPTQAALQIRSPFLLVEGKSYATSRTIYEAQHQAAVSGACSVKILHDLDRLVHTSDPGSYSRGQQPMVFSVCTEGPIHQLWVHYTTAEDGHNDSDRMYYIAQIKSCDVGIRDHVPGFLEAVDNVMRWGSCKHKETIAEQLNIVWQRSS